MMRHYVCAAQTWSSHVLVLTTRPSSFLRGQRWTRVVFQSEQTRRGRCKLWENQAGLPPLHRAVRTRPERPAGRSQRRELGSLTSSKCSRNRLIQLLSSFCRDYKCGSMFCQGGGESITGKMAAFQVNGVECKLVVDDDTRNIDMVPRGTSCGPNKVKDSGVESRSVKV